MARRKRPQFIAFSYISGRRLGKFRSLNSIFRKFPRERKAFNAVKRFNQRTGRNITTTRQIKITKRRMNISKRWQ